MLDSILKAGSRTDYNKESTMLLQAGDLLQDRSITVMVLVTKKWWNNKKKETKALPRTLSVNWHRQLSMEAVLGIKSTGSACWWAL